MSLSVRSFTFDSNDPYRIALWWCEALGVEPCPDDHPDDPAAICGLGEGSPRLLFERVPEGKAVKNRAHLDLLAGTGRARDAAVERLVSLGAAYLAEFRRPDGSGWIVLADPDGNEFCVEGLKDPE